MNKPSQYKIGRVNGDGQFTVGKDNSLTEVFYFDTFEQALAKYVELVGPEAIMRIIASHEELVQNVVDHIHRDWRGFGQNHLAYECVGQCWCCDVLHRATGIEKKGEVIYG